MEDLEKRTKWKIHETTRVFDLASFESPLPRTGLPKTYFVLRSKPWVNVIPVTKEGKVVLVRQFRHGVCQMSLELPGGIVDEEGPNGPRISAERELREETGYTAPHFELFLKLSGNPASFTNWSYSFLAKESTLTHPTEFDEGEEIEVVLASLEEVAEFINSGEIHHPHMVAVLSTYMYRQWRNRV